jgi:hypothetical protein
MTSGEQSIIMALGEIGRIQRGKWLAVTKREGYLDEARLLSNREPLNLASLARIDSRCNTVLLQLLRFKFGEDRTGSI